MAFRITTTGTQNPIIFGDLGGVSIPHPTVDYNLEDQFEEESIRSSNDVQAAIDNGWITVVDGNGIPITQTRGAVSHSELSGLIHDDHDQYVPRDASRGMTADWEAGNIKITADAGFETGDRDVHLASFANITGLLTGGEISVNAGDPTLLDIAAGTGIHVNMEDRDNPHVRIHSWPAQTIDPDLAGNRSKWVAMDPTVPGPAYDTTAIVQTTFSAAERRMYIVLGKFWGTGDATITTAKTYATSGFSFGKSMEDIASVLGSVNAYGNDYTPSAVGLKLKRSAGRSFRFAANYENNNLSPNVYESPESNPQNVYQYHVPGQTITIAKSLIDPDNYVDSTGNLVAVPTGKWTHQRVYYFPVSNTTHITYGQDYHDSKSLAYDSIIQDTEVFNDDILEGSILRAYLILQEGCTDLSNENESMVVKAYTDPGLIPGFTNHGELGGLLDDDHPQYHNDARGDDRYYQKAYIEQSENILYTYPGLTPPNFPFNVKTALDYNQGWVDDVGYSGRVSPEIVLVADTTNVGDILVLAGAGYISDGDQTLRILWNDYTIEGAGDFDQGNWYVYVDENGDVQTTNVLNESFSAIRLGFFYSYGNGLASSIIQCPCYINSAGNRIIKTLFDLGPFIHDESGSLQVSSNNDLALTAIQANVHWALDEYELEELDTIDNIGIDTIRNIFNSSDGIYRKDGWFSNPNGGNGIFPVDRYNDLTADGSSIIIASFTFTNGSNSVTVSGDYTSVIDKDDFIYLDSDTFSHMTPIQDSTTAIVFSGGITTITLEGNYTGTGGTGNATIVKSLPRIPSGKYAKHLVFRVLDGDLITIYGNELFDTEDDAKSGSLPDYPSSVKVYDVQIAYLLATPSLISWQGQIYDLRPLPFYREGGGVTGGGAVITNHSSLSGLSNDDHTQYLRTDGTRELIGIQRYATQPSFANDRAIITKKYVDDYFPVDHTTLTNIGTNTHAQIDTHIADASIHFTEASIDHNAITNTHNLTTDIDHNLLTNTHNLTTDINHNTILNNHNLTTDINHNLLTNYDPDRHFLFSDVTSYVEAVAITDSDGLWQILYLDEAASTGLSSTTSTTYQNKLSITTPAVAGTYRVSYVMEFNAQQNNKDVYVRLYNPTTATVYGENSQQTNNSNNWFTFSGFIYFTQGATANTFILQYRAGSATCQVRNATLELWRGA